MSPSQSIGEINWENQCAVCGKTVTGGTGFAHLNYQGRMVALCCPLCLETFEKKPAYFASLRAVGGRKKSADPEHLKGGMP